jgi:hypothetical protein
MDRQDKFGPTGAATKPEELPFKQSWGKPRQKAFRSDLQDTYGDSTIFQPDFDANDPDNLLIQTELYERICKENLRLRK